MSDLDRHDNWLTSDTAAAIVIGEPLVPVEGHDGVFFPATYSAAEDKSVFPGGYNVDPPTGEKNVCLVDSVGSQANRIEPLFAKLEYAELVPQILITAGEKSVNLLEAGHRAGDAIVRCTPLQTKLREAFRAINQGNDIAMAKIAPTSLVFGVWDSRDTQAKRPRLIASTIRAFDVQRLTRSAVYLPTLDYVKDGLIDEALDTGSGKDNPLSKKGYKHNPASASHGGVIARGGIRRDITFSLAALRLLSAGDNNEQTLALRRYILGLSLVALTAPLSTYLRQGCNLVPHQGREGQDREEQVRKRVSDLVMADGKRQPFSLSHEQAIVFARAAAKHFGVGESLKVTFDPEMAKKDLTTENEATLTGRRRAKAKGV
jgi:CRISPR-associated protein Csb1